MRILQLCYGMPPRMNAGNGGELRYWQNLASMVALGHEVHLVVCRSRDPLDPEVQRLPHSVRYIAGPERPISRVASWKSVFSDTSALEIFFPHTRRLRDEVADVVARIRPDIVWADWIGAMAIAPRDIPAIYSHSDFYYKILEVRGKTKSRRLRWPDRQRWKRLPRVEFALCNEAAHVVCASASEKQQLEGLACGSTYIPIVGPNISRPGDFSHKTGRVFLFGALFATSMKSAVRHLREQVWPLLNGSRTMLEWHQLGKPDPSIDEDGNWIRQKFVCHGFVGDLSGVFRLGDASLIPYQEDTGFRTKFVAAAGHGVVNIGYEQTFRCAPEFTAGLDCMVARSPSELTELLNTFAADAILRRRLGEASRALYEREFSFEAQLPKYEQALLRVGQK
jgi:glycosyltransferase involved in cell wall biosynthesis